jgi:hypothetical protein
VERIIVPKSGNIGNNDAKLEVELPSEVRSAIFLAVRRSITGLKAEVEAKRPRNPLPFSPKPVRYTIKWFWDKKSEVNGR